MSGGPGFVPPVVTLLDRKSADVHHGAMGYPTPEEAVLAEWESCPRAAVRIVKVRHKGKNHAVVVTDTVPSHPMWNYCERTGDGWEFTHDHN